MAKRGKEREYALQEHYSAGFPILGRYDGQLSADTAGCVLAFWGERQGQAAKWWCLEFRALKLRPITR